jgi:uncharacterized protein (TIGR03437 family)
MLVVGAASAFAASPQLAFFGSLNAQLQAATVDSAGNVYLTGTAVGPSFNTTSGAFQTTFNLGKACSTPQAYNGCRDAFIAKFSSAGDLIYATYIGGSGIDAGLAIAVDGAGSAYVAGYTYSSDFPVTANALNKTYTGATFIGCCSTPPGPGGEAFVIKLNPAGTALAYSTFLGGNGNDVGQTIGVDSQGNAYVTGWTDAPNFPVTPGAYRQKPFSGTPAPFVSKINPSGTALPYSTYFDEAAQAMALDAAGNVYLTGTAKRGGHFTASPGALQNALKGETDAFVAKLSADGSRLAYATFLGGSDNESGNSIAVDSEGDAWVVGSTASNDFQTTVGLPNQNGGAFVARINSSGSSLVFSARMGTGVSDGASIVLLDSAGNAFVNGRAQNPLTTPDAFEKTSCAGYPYAYPNFLAKWSPLGVLLYSSLLKEGNAVGMDTAGNLYLDTTYFYPISTRLARFNPTARPLSGSIACIGNAAQFGSGGISPGSIVSLYGDRLGPQMPATFKLNSAGQLPTELANTRVLFDGKPVPLLYVQSDQINAIAPWGLAAGTSIPTDGRSNIVVEYNGISSPLLPTPVAPALPGIFCLDAASPCRGAILNQDGTVNSPSNPAKRGSIISIFGTGFGLLNPIPQDGTIISDALHRVAAVVEVVFTGRIEAQVSYAGAAPMLVAGVTQINARIPDSLSDSAVAEGVTVSIAVAHSYPTPAPVSIAVK